MTARNHEYDSECDSCIELHNHNITSKTMAGSRLEKIGTIYTRTTGLLKSGALSWDDRPIWYDVYEAFPPKEEPRFDRPVPKLPLRKIFYPEDKIRATFHAKTKQIGSVNLLDTKYKSLTQKFIDNYKKLEGQYQGNCPQEQLYDEALDLLKHERDLHETHVSVASDFKEAERDSQIKLNVKDIFKE